MASVTLHSEKIFFLIAYTPQTSYNQINSGILWSISYICCGKSIKQNKCFTMAEISLRHIANSYAMYYF